ncbi:hypothetical protein JOD82_002174 [Paenibacillus sp. 1182]|uniref:hypothetical protein n=1 Tax=Paenibacillus sp. 1182 TaxID=2806565 RepID=UPI001B7783A2|nr:hypothetical protein [Paenibacillus sp. 1182]MBP1309154.1 hypothetical protein [Paenibacillus sp. 1182]
MDREMKFAWGRLLGETLRVQKRVDPSMVQASDATIYGLLNGFETVVDAQLSVNEPITEDDLNNMARILEPYHQNPDTLRGYYTIESEVDAANISRLKAMMILTYFKSEGRFEEVIRRMNTEHSPGECREFEIRQEEV